jgi:hypothetical protein
LLSLAQISIYSDSKVRRKIWLDEDSLPDSYFGHDSRPIS